MHKSKVKSAERAAFMDDMQALLSRLDASEYSLAAARLSSAIDALSDEIINTRAFPAVSSDHNNTDECGRIGGGFYPAASIPPSLTKLA